ncbi:MAG: glutathione peroxidase [Xanthobacteraceae bacterium]|nr:glutathione peroxidase [Xanthobacteraceae bacterium]
MAQTIYDFGARLNSGEMCRLSEFRGKVLLVVNVASRCGFTPQYRGLQTLYETFGARGFCILAFPCDQFGHQEPGTDAEIAAFCSANFAVTFPLFAKIEVNGAGEHPLFRWLKQQKGGFLGSRIKWNFTKFLVDRVGVVRARFAPFLRPERIAENIVGVL